jgi:hypothetical protein
LALCAIVWQVHPIAWGAQPSATFPTGPVGETAAIIPVGSFSVGNSLAYGSASNINYGYGLFANGITDYVRCAKSTTYDFVFFVFPAKSSVTQTVSFTVKSPGGATVYTYAYGRASISYSGTWYTAVATGNYATAGIYTASVDADGTQIGSIPLVCTA